MDMQMPEMDGLETTRRIRRQEKEDGDEHLRIIAMTANAMQGDRELCLAAGMDDYVSKPIRVELLIEALNQVKGHAEEAEEQKSRGAAGTAVAILNPTALDNLREMVGDDAFMVELIDTFLTDTPKLIGDMEKAVTTNDPPLLRLSAHSLKANSADFGATALHKLCVQLEGLGKDGEMVGTADLVTQVRAEYNQVENALQTLAQSLR
jgi:HPt (histidine-containing phosphotransfer) domain-containing protein